MIIDDSQDLFNLIDLGREGKNIGIPTGIPLLDDYICGIQKNTLTVLAGSTGSGKSTFALYAYVYKPLMANLDNDKYFVYYFSLEMSKEMLQAKLLSMYIYETYGLQVSYNDILSRKRILSDEIYEILTECRPWLNKIMHKLKIHDQSVTPDQLGNLITEYAKSRGTFEKLQDGTIRYTPNNPEETVLIAVDHLRLMKAEGVPKKVVMDNTSKILMEFRKVCHYSGLMLMQVNRTASSMDRRKGSMQETELGDLKETGDPAEDSDVVIALFNPLREKMTTYRGMPIDILRDNYRSAIVLKSRFGVGEQGVHLNFHGNVGLFYPMPDADEITDWAPYTMLGFKEEIKESKPQEEVMFTL